MRQIIFLMSFLALTSCNSWDSDDKDAWRQACQEQAKSWTTSETDAKTYCDCVLAKMIKKYPDENQALEHIEELAKDSSLLNCRREIENKQSK